MHPLIFDLGFFQLRWYGVMIALGILLGTNLAARRAAKYGQRLQEQMFEFAFYAVLAAIVGARVWEVLFTWSDYAQNPLEAFAFWHGGMSIQGSIVGGFLVALWYVRKHKINFWTLADIAAPGVILGQGIGRIGCIMNGDAYGIPAPKGAWYGVVYARGTPAYHVYGRTPLYPAEAMEGLADLVICAILLTYKPKKDVQGRVFLMYATLYGVARFCLEFLRGDSLRFYGFKAQQLASLAIVVIGAAVLAYNYRKGTPPEEPSAPASAPAPAPVAPGASQSENL